MYYAVGTQSIKSTYYGRGRPIERIDGVFPTQTMRLHRRLIDWHRKRQIPVRDADKASSLSAYLIDPKFLKKGGVTRSKDIPVTYVPSNIRVYQYSQITRDAPASQYVSAGPLSIAAQQIWQNLNTATAALGAELSARYRTLITPNTNTHYVVGSGVSPRWKQQLKLFSAAILTGGLLVAAVALDSNKSANPSPVSAHPKTTTSQASAATDSGTQHSRAVTPPTHNSQSRSAASSDAFTEQQTQAAMETQKQNQVEAVTHSVANPVTNTIVDALPDSITTPPTTVTEPIPSTPESEPLGPIINPVTDTVNDVLSTQITVNLPLTSNETDQQLIEISQ